MPAPSWERVDADHVRILWTDGDGSARELVALVDYDVGGMRLSGGARFEAPGDIEIPDDVLEEVAHDMVMSEAGGFPAKLRVRS